MRELTPEQLIGKARAIPNSLDSASLYLEAATQYWQNELYAQSNAALDTITPEHLSYSELQQFLTLTLTLSIQEENHTRIEQTLPLISTQSQQKTSVPQQIELTKLIIRANQILGRHIQAAVTLIEHAGLFPEEEQYDGLEEIWQSLRQADAASLSQYQYTGTNLEVIAWLDLARLIQQNQINLETQYQALQDWKKVWPNHPAALHPPHELSILEALPKTRPTSITLALPLTGPISGAGKAIRDGFMANYYANNSNQNDEKLEIHFFDTNKNSISELYANHLSENALIIGPLDKNALNEVSKLDSLHTKTLALNHLDSPTTHDNLFQFGLAPETETTQLAQRLIKKKLYKVGVIAPESNWGFRIHDAFAQALSNEGGTLIESAFYQDQSSLSETVARLLNTDESKQRKRRIQTITNTNFEFLPRRRQDIDAIFMIAKPETAKQLKPLFAYHYANNLPVFATSQVHKQSSDGANKDLERIEFIEMPWMLSNTIDIKNQLTQIIPDSNEKYSRFYALGVDAFNLAPRLELLHEIQDSQIQGQTGTLSMGEGGIISRKMEWAKFRKGNAISIKN